MQGDTAPKHCIIGELSPEVMHIFAQSKFSTKMRKKSTNLYNKKQ